jgi:hypothetical protein
MGERRGVCRVLGGKPEAKRQLGRPMSRWEDNIKMDLMKWDVGHELDRTGSGKEQVGRTFECGNEPSICIKCGEFLD